MAKNAGQGAELVYEAAERWRESCLRVDGSLFLPGRAVWTLETIQDLRKRFIDKPDASKRSFQEKLADQLAGASTSTIVLMAEVLFVHLLIAKSIRGKRKRTVINEVLSWAPEPVTIPTELGAALDHGLAMAGTGFNTGRPFMLRVIVRLAEHWKQLPLAARETALQDPWAFREELWKISGERAWSQRHALLHLAHPDNFEDILSEKHKEAIVATYGDRVVSVESDIDRKLREIRESLEAEAGGPIWFYDENHKPIWLGPSPKERPKRVSEPPNGTGYWKIAPGEKAWHWDACRDGGFISVGWEKLGDLRKLDRTAFENRVAEVGYDGKGWQQVWIFAKEIRLGDRIVANRGTSELLGIGTVVGPYDFLLETRHGHRIPVRWDDVNSRTVDEPGWRRTIVKLTRDHFEKLAGTAGAAAAVPPSDTEVQPGYDLSDCAAETHFDLARLERFVRAIDRKKHAVLFGPPGTGKTFLARHLARHLIGGGDGFMELVQFHPAYAYEDFVLGIRPRTGSDGKLRYENVPGRFVEFCERARKRSGCCVLVVDEINRANLARVFGELMYLLEYRDEEVPLAGGRLFRIPANVRLIGTMNTADRSIALVDHALRRRFAFLELAPDYRVLERFHATSSFSAPPLIKLLRRVNAQIDDRNYHIGVSFFLRKDLGEHLEDIWRMELEPYLREFFYDDPSKADDLGWDRVRGDLGK